MSLIIDIIVLVRKKALVVNGKKQGWADIITFGQSQASLPGLLSEG